MDFTPHTERDVTEMLAALGMSDVDELFAHLPAEVRVEGDLNVGDALSEPELMAYVDSLANTNERLVCFAGGGHYDHYIPPTVRALTLRSEFVTSYTPYQPEVSQGVLQALFEFQSMVCAVTGLEIANASLYDGAGAALEAVNVAVAATRRNVIWVSRGVSPRIRETIATFGHARGVSIVEHPLSEGRTIWDPQAQGPPAAVVVAQPNYLGVVEDYQAAVGIAHAAGALAIASIDPMTAALLESPGSAGFDMAIAEGQPLGNPMAFGGPGVGLFAMDSKHIRRLPGRLVGRTVDGRGRLAYVLTLRAREQDIRRDKASSNICTNQSLNAIAVAIQLSWLGPDGLREVGRQAAHKAHYLASKLCEIEGVSLLNSGSFVREFSIRLPISPSLVIEAMTRRGFLAGISLKDDYPELDNGLLVAVTEKRTGAEIDRFVAEMKEVIENV